ncbi:MAG: hypothetical protein ABR878_18090, partial [Roseiarcus sp.]
MEILGKVWKSLEFPWNFLGKIWKSLKKLGAAAIGYSPSSTTLAVSFDRSLERASTMGAANWRRACEGGDDGLSDCGKR